MMGMKLITVDFNGIEIECEYEFTGSTIFTHGNIEINGMFIDGLDWRSEELLTQRAIDQIEALAIVKLKGE
jgi:hypothetical protein